MKRLLFLLTATLIALLISSELLAIQLIYRDHKGHYHYRCTDKTGGKTVIQFRNEGIFVNGPTGQVFYPMDTASVARSAERIKVVERYARMGCRERLRQQVQETTPDQE